ncbi:MAG TPA: PrsW family glutamic-type intramembrane protease [Gemmataceae bacterium]|nr:PrsW family glutamic-type intramembrane protease [Gemmataceae bacterium]
MIPITCPSCGRQHEVSPALAGLVVVCKGCAARLPVADPAAAPTAPPPPVAPPPSSEKAEPTIPLPPLPRPPPSTPARDLPAWLRHGHWLLVLALLPLAVSLLRPGAVEESRVARLRQALRELSPEEQERVVALATAAGDDDVALEVLFDAFPGHKVPGALLARDTWLHWAFGAAAGALFLGFFIVLATRTTAEPLHLPWVALFTATIGIGLLLLFQRVADWSQGVWVTGRGLLVLLFYVVKFVGYSYRAALDPENGLALSFVGYACGVGLCEEVVKALPVLWFARRAAGDGWRPAFLWGLASGAGFGVAEAIMYAGHYNGFFGAEAYLVRFVSCVALHAVWTGSVGVALCRQQDALQEAASWYEFVLPVLRGVGVPVVLHGLYDTLLKKGLDAGALVVAGFSFLYLAYQISRMYGDEDRAAARKPAPVPGPLGKP